MIGEILVNHDRLAPFIPVLHISSFTYLRCSSEPYPIRRFPILSFTEYNDVGRDTRAGPFLESVIRQSNSSDQIITVSTHVLTELTIGPIHRSRGRDEYAETTFFQFQKPL